MTRKLPLALGILLFTGANAIAQTGNVGIGTPTPGSKLTVNGSFAATYNKQTGTTYAIGATDYYVAGENAGASTFTLPAVAPASPTIQGRQYFVKNTGAGTLTLAANGSERLDNQTGSPVTSIAIAPGYCAVLIATGNTTVSASTAQWEVAIVASGTYVEPWYDVATNSPATTNTQNIYQMGFVGINTPTPGSRLTIRGDAGLGDDIRVESYNSASPFVVLENNGGAIGSPTNLTYNTGLGGFMWATRNNGAVNNNARIVSTYKGDGLTGLTDMNLIVGAGSSLYIDSARNVGVNTTSPDYKLTVQSPAVGNGIAIDLAAASNNAQWLNFRKSRGTTAAPAFNVSGDGVGTIAFSPFSGSGAFTQSASFRAEATENHSASALGTELQWWTTPAGSNILAKRATLTDAGNLGIATTTPVDRLSVFGAISASNNTDATAGTATTTIGTGGIELSRSLGFNGYIDMKDTYTDDYDARIYYDNASGGANGSMRFLVSTTGTHNVSNTAMFIENANGYMAVGTKGLGPVTPSSDFQNYGTTALSTATSGTTATVVLQNAGTFTPPTASTCPSRVYIIRNTSTTTNLTVANTINFSSAAAGSITVTPAAGSIMISSDGTNWYRIL